MLSVFNRKYLSRKMEKGWQFEIFMESGSLQYLLSWYIDLAMESGCKSVQLKKLYGTILGTETENQAKQAAILSVIKMAVSDYSHFSFLLNQVDWFCTSNLSLMPLLGKVLRAYRGTSKTASKVICNLLAGGLCIPNANIPVVDLLVNIIQTYKDNIIALESLRENYPHKVCDSQMHICYVESLLKLCEKIPSQRYNLLEIIIQNLASFDTEMSLGQYYSSKILYEDETVLQLTEQCDLFENKYDQILSRVLQFTSKFDQQGKENLLKEFYLIFQKIMMTVDNIKAVQYVAFNLAEASPANSFSFIAMLITTIIDNFNKKQSKKVFIAAVQYLRSYLCRSMIVPQKNVKKIFLSFLSQLEQKLSLITQVNFEDLNLNHFGEQNMFVLYLLETVLFLKWKFPYLSQTEKINTNYLKIIAESREKLHYYCFIDAKLLSIVQNQQLKKKESYESFSTIYVDRFLPVFLPKTQSLIKMKLNVKERRLRPVFSLQESTQIHQIGNNRCRKMMSGQSNQNQSFMTNYQLV